MNSRTSVERLGCTRSKASQFAIGALLVLLGCGALAETTEPSARIDPKKIINESNNFLRNREPEMSAEEFALYEKVVSMISSNPAFALRLLEGMLAEKEKAPSPAFEFILGNTYYQSGKIEDAEKRYKSAIAAYPEFLRAWNNLGVLYYTNGRHNDAVPCFSKSIALGDRDPTTYGLLAVCLEKQENFVASEVSYLQAIAGAPNSTDWMEGLLRIYMRGRQFGRAELIAKQLVKGAPKEARYWLVYSNILISSGRKTEAIAVLETASRLTTLGAEELSLLGDLYAEQNLASEAIASYEKLKQVSPKLGENRQFAIVSMYLNRDDLDQAEKMLSGLERGLSPSGRLEYLQARADLCTARGQWPAARVCCEEILTQSPLNGRALVTLGHAFAMENNPERAGFALEAASRIPESCYRASLELANLAIQRRAYDKAVEHLEKALSLNRTSEVQDTLTRIKTLVAHSSPSSS